MEEKELIENLEVFKSIKNKIEAEANETNYSTYRDILETTIQDYNRMMTDVRIKQLILKNRRRALESKQALEEAQTYLMDYCKSINVFTPQKQDLMPVPEVAKEELDIAVGIWKTIGGLDVIAGKAGKLIEELKDAEKQVPGSLKRYSITPYNKSLMDNFLNNYIDNAEKLIPTLQAPELEELRQQNKEIVRKAINTLNSLDFEITQLLRLGVKPFDESKISAFEGEKENVVEALKVSKAA